MFGDDAPIWKFLDRIGARENPIAAREASTGLFLIEVFPALALATIVSVIWHRKRAAKYNPGNRAKFVRADWELVTDGIARWARQSGVEPIMAAADELAHLQYPRKSDQDKLDALICLAIAWTWRHHPREASMIIGDGVSGYMVTPVNGETGPVLAEAAQRKIVQVDDAWTDDARRTKNQLSSSEFKQPVNEAARPKIDRSAPKSADQTATFRKCPECGHAFKGKGWGGIDAHWRTYHEDIMPYGLAWPIIKDGGTPSKQNVV